MGKVIICETETTKNPYIFDSTKVQIYSYEELCYYLYEYSVLIDCDTFQKELFEWIRTELNMEELTQVLYQIKESQHHMLSDYYQVIFQAANYYDRQEVLLLFERIKAEQELPESMRLKKKADVFLNLHKYTRAIHYYDEILQMVKEKKEKATAFHNKGVALCKNFELEEAVQCFEEAYLSDQNMNSLQSYCIAMFLLKKEEEAKSKCVEWNVDLETFETWRAQYKKEIEDMKETGAFADIKKLRFHQSQGNHGDYQQKVQHILEQWKQNYRREMS